MDHNRTDRHKVNRLNGVEMRASKGRLFFLFNFLFTLRYIVAEEQFSSLTEDEMEQLLFANDTGTQLEPDQVFEILKRFSKTLLGLSDNYRNIVDELISLNDPEFCEKESLYDRNVARSIRDYPNLYRYIYAKFKERLDDGCLEEYGRPDFLSEYERYMESQKAKMEKMHNYNELWSKLNGNDKLRPLETLDILRGLEKLESNPKKKSYLEKLVGLAARIDLSGDCDNPDAVLEGYISTSFLSIPNVENYISHFQSLRTDDCRWLKLSSTQKRNEAVDVEPDCKLLMESKKLGCHATFLNSKAIISQRPATCDERSMILAGDVVDLALCEAKECCNFVRPDKKIREAIESVPLFNDIERVENRLRYKARKTCGASIHEENLPLLEKLSDQVMTVTVIPPKSSLKEYLDYKVPSSKTLSILSKTKPKKLSHLEPLMNSCSDIVRAVPTDLGREYRRISAVEVGPEDHRLVDAWKWCMDNQKEMEDTYSQLEKKSSLVSSCLTGHC